MRVLYTPEFSIIQRLEKWPEVSGTKPLRGEWAGYHRIRTGDWRVLFRVVAPDVVVWASCTAHVYMRSDCHV